MATTKLMKTKEGREFYKISISRGYGQTPYTRRWYVPEGLAASTIKRGLEKAIRDFEKDIEAGNIETRAEKKEREKFEALEAAKIKTIRQYGETVFMPIKAQGLEEKTRSYYQNALNHHIYPEFAEMPITEINSAMLTAFLLKEQKRNYSKSTINGIYVTLNQLFKMAYYADIISHNPMDKVARPKMTKQSIKNEDVECLTREELSYILECADKEPIKWKTFINLLAFTGLRVGEAVGLKWSVIDFKNMNITVSNNVCYTSEKGLYETSPKGKTKRVIPIDAHLADLFMELRKETCNKLVSPYCFPMDGVLGKPMHPDSPARYLQRFTKKYDLQVKLHPHIFRHTYASIMVSSGADVASVSALLGHADISTTLRMYVHPNEESKKNAVDAFTKSLNYKKAF